LTEAGWMIVWKHWHIPMLLLAHRACWRGSPPTAVCTELRTGKSA
jgi:hypothetical protein